MWENPMRLFCTTLRLLFVGARPKPQEKMLFEKQAFVLIIKGGCGKLWLRGWTQAQNEVENSLAFNYVLMKPTQTGPWAQQLPRNIFFFRFLTLEQLGNNSPRHLLCFLPVFRKYLYSEKQWMPDSSPGLGVRGVVKHFLKCITRCHLRWPEGGGHGTGPAVPFWACSGDQVGHAGNISNGICWLCWQLDPTQGIPATTKCSWLPHGSLHSPSAPLMGKLSFPPTQCGSMEGMVMVQRNCSKKRGFFQKNTCCFWDTSGFNFSATTGPRQAFNCRMLSCALLAVMGSILGTSASLQHQHL